MTEMIGKTEYSKLYVRLTGLSAVLFSVFILLKPYYLKPSGSIGTADICLAAAGTVMLMAEFMRIMPVVCRANDENEISDDKLMPGTLFENAAEKKLIYEASSENTGNVSSHDKCIPEPSSADVKKAVSKRGWRETINACVNELLYRQDAALYAFILLAAAVNAVYSSRSGSHEYTKYTVYWLYNGFAIWTLRKLKSADPGRCYAGKCSISSAKPELSRNIGDSAVTDEHAINEKKSKSSTVLQNIRKLSFDDKICCLLEIDIILQFIIMLSGRGRYFVEYWGAVRYMGSFNDPNQLAFFMFVSMLLIYSLKAENDRKLHLPIYVRFAVYVSAVIVIIKTKSTGIMLGAAAFAFLSWCRWIWEAMQSGRISKKLITAVVIICAVCAAALLIYIWPPADFDVKNVEYNTLTRIQEKLWKLSQGGIGGFLIDRGGGKLAAFPQYMLFGAGEGGFDRFAVAGQEINEIHCSIMSILFCYGIIPTLFMIKWTADSFKNKNGRQLCACLALIAESMTLINYRQPMFWFLLM